VAVVGGCSSRRGHGLGWAGLGWAGLGWAGLGWAGLQQHAARGARRAARGCRLPRHYAPASCPRAVTPRPRELQPPAHASQVITGFLGAGKTTLVNYVLNEVMQ
jgi:hypothetical protein